MLRWGKLAGELIWHRRSSNYNSGIPLDPLVRLDPSLQTAAFEAGASLLVPLVYLPISVI